MREKLIDKIYALAERLEEDIYLDLKSLSNDDLTEMYVDFRIQDYLLSLLSGPEEAQVHQSCD
jgi:hypothetical protein